MEGAHVSSIGLTVALDLSSESELNDICQTYIDNFIEEVLQSDFESSPYQRHKPPTADQVEPYHSSTAL
ncbi:unnamed protein product [Didymodactylos carnosus]|uniref:Uncharacterized protein n=2 Tax=Didymodactylos carnosus TaxID=1234261 RepID=A0A815EMG4_9BILA|nr:unnamed protein product [Didymodactylos carnosus]CAF4150199.1 unnamed protein product [Didymodactylos carnosus]